MNNPINTEANGKRDSYVMLSRLIAGLCKYSAIIGGILLYVLALVVTVSAIMREMKYGGITGIYELIEFTCGISAFLFLPLCQLEKGHVTVDLFTNALPQFVKSVMENFWGYIFAACWFVLAYCMLMGGLDKFEYEDVTQELELQYWIVYVFGVYGTVLSGLVAILQSSDLLKTTNEKVMGAD